MLVLVAVLASACKKAEPPAAKNEFEAFERKFVAETKLLAEAARREGRKFKESDVPKSYRAVFIGPSGVFVDRQLIATLAELDTKRVQLVEWIADNAKLENTGLTMPQVTLDLDEQPAATVIAALRLFAGREMFISVRRENPELPMRASQILCSRLTIRDEPSETQPHLSVLLDPGTIYVGLSRGVTDLPEIQVINDLSGQVRDYDKLDATLRDHKSSDAFKERIDGLEVGASAGTGSDVLAVVDLACKYGYVDLAVLPRDKLSVVPDPD